MLHQIRKMVGLVIAVVRGYASLETINLCWTANKVRIIQLRSLLFIILKTFEIILINKKGRCAKSARTRPDA